MDADASGITGAIVAFLDRSMDNGPQIKNMVAIATDGTRVMVGKHNSVFTLLKERLSIEIDKSKLYLLVSGGRLHRFCPDIKGGKPNSLYMHFLQPVRYFQVEMGDSLGVLRDLD